MCYLKKGIKKGRSSGNEGPFAKSNRKPALPDQPCKAQCFNNKFPVGIHTDKFVCLKISGVVGEASK